jgi:hypothetical protein
MPSKDELVCHTHEFFNKHWGFNNTFPEWDFSWNWCGPVPNYLVGGVYALLKNNEILYIGLGNSRGGGIYQDRGISRRLMAHVTQSAPTGSSVDSVLRKRWIDLEVDKVATLGFAQCQNYLAPALEDFLIGHLNPIENRVKRKSVN